MPYRAAVVEFDNAPLLSFVDGSSAFGQVFNPSWVEATPLTGGVEGLLVRTQNCTGCGVGYDPVKAPEATRMCCYCAGTGPNASSITFSRQVSPDTAAGPPKFAFISPASTVFGPVDSTDARGTEDPRIQFDAATNLYYMFYTCWHADHTAKLCLATSTNPTSAEPSAWTRHGEVFGDVESKSAALLPPGLRRPDSSSSSSSSSNNSSTKVYTLIHGAGKISYTESADPLSWPEFGDDFITNVTWATGGGNANVEAGPPPMQLSDGNLVFFFNSWCNSVDACPKDVPPPGCVRARSARARASDAIVATQPFFCC